jgi:tRNA 2-thiouridine synthesizing protein A
MTVKADETLDCSGLSCPMPILKLAKGIKNIDIGQVLELLATDPGSKTDVPAWCEKTGHEFIESTEEKGTFKYYLRRVK